MPLKKYLFKLARSNLSGYFLGFVFEKLSAFIPVEKITENKYVFVFHHPVKHWQRHILIVPKKSIRNFLSIDLDNDWGKDMTISVFKTGAQIAKIQKIDKYTILVNGGKYQDVPQVHFHLASGNDKLGGVLVDEKTQLSSDSKIVFESSSASICSIYDDKVKKHFIVKSKKDLLPINKFDFENIADKSSFVDILGSIQLFLKKQKLTAFTVSINHENENNLLFHISCQ